MCGSSDFKYKEKDINIFIGYYGGSVDIGGIKITDESTEEDRNKFVANLVKEFSANDLAEILLSTALYAEEA